MVRFIIIIFLYIKKNIVFGLLGLVEISPTWFLLNQSLEFNIN
jgi:hypothetical protein